MSRLFMCLTHMFADLLGCYVPALRPLERAPFPRPLRPVSRGGGRWNTLKAPAERVLDDERRQARVPPGPGLPRPSGSLARTNPFPSASAPSFAGWRQVESVERTGFSPSKTTSSISPQRSTRSPRARTLRGLPCSVGVGASFPAPPEAPRPATAAASSGFGGRGASDTKSVCPPRPRLTLAPGRFLHASLFEGKRGMVFTCQQAAGYAFLIKRPWVGWVSMCWRLAKSANGSRGVLPGGRQARIAGIHWCRYISMANAESVR